MFMLNTSDLKQHELRILSGMARHVSLQTECAKYSEELSAFLKDKDTLLVDVVKALKRITNEWRSWNHKLFGGLSPKAYVASVDQIFELLEWTEKTYPNIHQQGNCPKSHWKFCVDTLRRYISAHAQMQRFYSKFVQSICSPLTIYYTGKNTRATAAALRNTLNKWSILQQTNTMISERCFTADSMQFFMEIMYYPGCRDFYLVLRLIPDLCMKAAECIQLAKLLLDTNESGGFSREKAYIFEVWRPIQRLDMKSPWERKLCELTKEKDQVEKRSRELSLQRRTIQESKEEVNGNLESFTRCVEAKTESKNRLLDYINTLTEGFIYKRFQAKELKRDIANYPERSDDCQRRESLPKDAKRERMIGLLSRNASEESTPSYSRLRHITSPDRLDALKIALKATEIEVEKIQELLTSARNDLFKVENDLTLEAEKEKQFSRKKELLEKDELELNAKSGSVELEERVLAGFVQRIRKNIKNSYDKLPPIPALCKHNCEQG